MDKDFKIIIPARWASTRFPGKPLAEINGKPLIQHTYEHAIKCHTASQVVIATDDERIADASRRFDADVHITREHPSGTDRLAQVASERSWGDNTIIVNLQCDEPTMPHANIQQVVNNLRKHINWDVSTLYRPITKTNDMTDHNIVKVVFDLNGKALYFSHSLIPYAGAKNRHIGIYAYWVHTLRWFRHLEQCELEKAESLEQLRILWNGGTIHVAKALRKVGPSVDIPNDIEKVKAYLHK